MVQQKVKPVQIGQCRPTKHAKELVERDELDKQSIHRQTCSNCAEKTDVEVVLRKTLMKKCGLHKRKQSSNLLRMRAILESTEQLLLSLYFQPVRERRYQKLMCHVNQPDVTKLKCSTGCNDCSSLDYTIISHNDPPVEDYLGLDSFFADLKAFNGKREHVAR